MIFSFLPVRRIADHRSIVVVATLAVALLQFGAVGTHAQIADSKADFTPLLACEKLWEMSQNQFVIFTELQRLPFEWTSNAHDSARAGWRGMALFGRPVYEVIARFNGGKLVQVTANFYARGDAGDLTKEKYTEIVKASVQAVSDHAKVKSKERGKDMTNAVKADGCIWDTPAAHYLLEYSATKEVKTRDILFRAEFVRLEVTPPEKQLSLLASAHLPSASKPRFKGVDHVDRDSDKGDVFIRDVPMVDQGQKGYCVVATTERVMRYYGADVDANELAQAANTRTTGGTSSDAMREALKKLTARLKVRYRDLEQIDIVELKALMKEYNRVAKKNGVAELPDPGYFYDFEVIFGAMKADVLKEARTRNKADTARFLREVQQHIDAGIPLIWGVQLGIFPERGIGQGGGGHVRLIIGYNAKTNEILFSDSWGAGHELKRKPLDEAWTITTGLMKIEPQS